MDIYEENVEKLYGHNKRQGFGLKKATGTI